jgi:hypothetical protein
VSARNVFGMTETHIDTQSVPSMVRDLAHKSCSFTIAFNATKSTTSVLPMQGFASVFLYMLGNCRYHPRLLGVAFRQEDNMTAALVPSTWTMGNRNVKQVVIGGKMTPAYSFSRRCSRFSAGAEVESNV